MSAAAAISPSPSPQEAAAIIAAIECFVRDTAAPAPPPRRQTSGGWVRAARLESVGRAPGPAAASGDWHPWRDSARSHHSKH